MASPALCAYCYEILSSHLEDRQPLSFGEVLDLYARWEATATTESHVQSTTTEDQSPPSAGQLAIPSIQRVQGASSSSSSTSLSLNSATPASSTSSASSPPSLSASSSRAALVPNSKSPAAAPSSSATPSRVTMAAYASVTATVSDAAYPLFVTWNTVSRHEASHKALRGCIGTFEAQELGTGLSSYALTAALHDSRFSPITLAELPTLSCSVTLLTNFTTCAEGPLDWDIGTHGIRIAFAHRGRRYGATYLPDVAAEQGWTKEETMVSLMRKAGWSGRSKDWREVWEQGKGQCTRYEGKKASLGWSEWRTWRRWVDGA